MVGGGGAGPQRKLLTTRDKELVSQDEIRRRARTGQNQDGDESHFQVTSSHIIVTRIHSMLNDTPTSAMTPVERTITGQKGVHPQCPEKATPSENK